MRGINHPGIVKLISFSESPEHYFLVLERTANPFLLRLIVTDDILLQLWRAAHSSTRS